MSNMNDTVLSKDVLVKVGICAMNKKTYARPMKEILKRLKKVTTLEFIVFTDDTILQSPVEDWPIVDCFISFYSDGFPLDKAIKYAELRKPHVLNDLETQYHLQDRRETYRILEEAGLNVPRYAVFNRDENNEPLTSSNDIEELDDTINVNGVTFHKPFVEKPVDAEDHNIHIYYPDKAGGGHQKLFRKIGTKSSAYSPESTIRRTGSYIYEDFMYTDGTDVKVYAIGEEYAHAEARKAPSLDGNVERDSGGKEVRYPVILTAHEKKIAKRVCKAFKQTVNGFDLLRSNGKSFICDVNGFSFVKTSQKYYDDASQLLAEIILQKLAPQLWIPQSLSPVTSRGSPERNKYFRRQVSGRDRELRSVIALIRHGDRTPKQKIKMVVTHPLYQKFFEDNDGNRKGQLKIKNPKRLQELLDIARTLLEQIENGAELQESHIKLMQMKTVLEMYGHFSGINRKVQFKAITDKRNNDLIKLKGRNKEASMDHPKSLLLILKWGGELTSMGREQAEDLGKAFRSVYPNSERDVYGNMPGFGFLRLHSTYRHDLKIYASDEGRVQMTAAAFAKGLLALEGELTPILVSLVHSDKKTTDMLDTPADLQKQKLEVKSRLHNHLHSTEDFTEADEEKLSPTGSSSIIAAMREIKNPYKVCEMVDGLIKSLVKQVNEECEKQDLQCEMTSDLKNDGERCTVMGHMRHRWEKLEKDFIHDEHFDISLIPDIYDCAKYDYLHNGSLGLSNIAELYSCTKLLADIVIPLEYGISKEERLTISKSVCNLFYRKIKGDLHFNVNQLEDTVYRLDPRNISDIANPHRHVRTRLYFSSESHVHSVINALRDGDLFQNELEDNQWKCALDYIKHTSELNYLTQIVFMQYEDLAVDPLSNDRFHIEIYFSPGVKLQIPEETNWRVHQPKESKQEIISNTTIGLATIETDASCHPLIRLHSKIGQKQMERFLEELSEDYEVECPLFSPQQDSLTVDCMDQLSSSI